MTRKCRGSRQPNLRVLGPHLLPPRSIPSPLPSPRLASLIFPHVHCQPLVPLVSPTSPPTTSPPTTSPRVVSHRTASMLHLSSHDHLTLHRIPCASPPLHLPPVCPSYTHPASHSLHPPYPNPTPPRPNPTPPRATHPFIHAFLTPLSQLDQCTSYT